MDEDKIPPASMLGCRASSRTTALRNIGGDSLRLRIITSYGRGSGPIPHGKATNVKDEGYKDGTGFHIVRVSPLSHSSCGPRRANPPPFSGFMASWHPKWT